MDMLFVDGNILTMDPKMPKAQALGVSLGRIAWVGSSEEAELLKPGARKVIDLGGRTMVPGFIDTHNHFCMTAFLRSQVDCRATSGCLKAQDVVDALRQRAELTPEGSWILGWGYASYLLEDRKQITREDLDRASIKHPICLVHVSVHEAVVNSLGLKRLGYGPQSIDPPGGRIVKDRRGVPNGVLQESAIMGPLFFANPSIYSQIMEKAPSETRIQMMEECASYYQRLGITCVHDPLVDPLTLRTYQEALDKGRLWLRIRPYVLNRWAEPLVSGGILPGFGSQWLKIGGVKIFLDGGMSSRTAALSRPYAGGIGGRGILNYEAQELLSEVRFFHERGYRISVHAQGDRAIEILLRAFRKAMGANNRLRHHVVHAGNISPSQLNMAASLALYITSQANFFSLLGDGFLEAFGPRRSRTLYPFKTILHQGIRLALSSDSPVADPNPLLGLRDAVLRKTEAGKELGPHQRLTVEEALPLYSREAAFFSCEEDQTGTLSPGKWADLAVLEKDPGGVSPGEILACTNRLTMIGGKIVHCDL